MALKNTPPTTTNRSSSPKVGSLVHFVVRLVSKAEIGTERSHRNEKIILPKVELKRKRLRKTVAQPFDFGTTIRKEQQ